MNAIMEVANLTCRSITGDKELLDIFEDYFLPAIKSIIIPGSRKSETHSYSFLDLKVEKIEGNLILHGRLVKSLNIEREQILEKGKLVDSIETLRSDPSSYFILFLNNHKLLWLRELKRAPKLTDLKYVLKKTFKIYREKTISLKCEKEAKSFFNDDTPTKEEMSEFSKIERKFYSLYPQLEVEITPLGNNVNISEEFNNFSLITNIKLRALKRNQEIGNEYNDLLSSMSAAQEKVLAKDVITEIRGTKQNALSIEETKKIALNASDGNYEYSIKGYDTGNNLVIKKESDFSLQLTVEYDKNTPILMNIKKMISKYFEAVNKYNTIQQVPSEVENKAIEIENKLGQLNND